MRLAKRLAFLHLDNFFGVTRGEQPLVRASRASAGADDDDVGHSGPPCTSCIIVKSVTFFARKRELNPA